MNKAELAIIEAADKQTSQTLVEVLDMADIKREYLLLDRDRYIDEIQALNLTCAGVTASLVNRHKALDDAIDAWCDDTENTEDFRTMARFIVDHVAANPEVIA